MSKEQESRGGQKVSSLGGDEPPLGAHLITQRFGYSHHGIYIGGGRVVHYAGLSDWLRRGPVEEVSLGRFAAGHEVFVIPHAAADFSGMEAVRRARSRLGENRYRLLSNNCEHFCTWCLYGQSRSRQVDRYLEYPRQALAAIAGFFEAAFTLSPVRISFV